MSRKKNSTEGINVMRMQQITEMWPHFGPKLWREKICGDILFERITRNHCRIWITILFVAREDNHSHNHQIRWCPLLRFGSKCRFHMWSFWSRGKFVAFWNRRVYSGSTQKMHTVYCRARPLFFCRSTRVDCWKTTQRNRKQKDLIEIEW